MTQVSVIIPVYNIERHLRQCLDSVTGQTLTELEIICVDDGSTDGSPEILVDYAQRDGRFQIITQPNTGPGVARNTGMDRATGEYLIFLDSDDWFEPDFLERMVAKAKETGADVTICRTVEFDTDTGAELPSEWMLKERYTQGNLCPRRDGGAHFSVYLRLAMGQALPCGDGAAGRAFLPTSAQFRGPGVRVSEFNSGKPHLHSSECAGPPSSKPHEFGVQLTPQGPGGSL